MIESVKRVKKMKTTIASFLCVLVIAASACANPPRERKKPQDRGRPDKTDHVRQTPHDNGRPDFTVDGWGN